MRKLYISQLEVDLQLKIKTKLIKYFKEDLELSDDEEKTELELAMNSRVSDLEDTIDIEKIINQK